MDLVYKTFLIFFILLTYCCQPANDGQRKGNKDNDQMVDNITKIREVYYRFPDPNEIFLYIKTYDLSYNPGLLHSPKSVSKYLDSKKQSLNFGIYIADLALITVFQKHQDALEYFDVLYSLSDKLHISAAFKPSLIKRFEENLNNADSLRVLSDESMNCITDYLSRNQKDKTFAMMSIGGFVETLYLTFSLVGDYSEENEIIQRMSDQKVVLENLISFAEQFSDDANISESLAIIKPIYEQYSALKMKEEETTVAKANDGRIIIGGGVTIQISELQYQNIRDAVTIARNEIINN